ncbi:MAG: hypothetical protein KDD74_00410 [Anaerolineales bacterium]|nr:hypothetical protein [Anaerolineales bacterium]
MSVTGFSPSLAQTFVAPYERAALETLAYSDIFEYPLTLDELLRYLPLPSQRDELATQLSAIRSIVYDKASGYYHLNGRKEIIAIRESRQSASLASFKRALKYGRIMGHLPFVRMVSMTGSLAVLNLSKNADMDFMLITTPRRLWVARAFAVTFGRLMRLTGDRICVNLLVSENALEWTRHDLYSAREMGQMIPIVGASVYRRLRDLNPWVESFLPNAVSAPEHSPKNPGETGSRLQKLLEFLLPKKLGNWLDGLLMNIQLRKISRKYGRGMESNFTVEICQGNFHNHRTWADEFFHARLVSLGLNPEEVAEK